MPLDPKISDNPKGDLTVRLVAMPADTNANGDIFGGWVMSQMDQAGGIARQTASRTNGAATGKAPAQETREKNVREGPGSAD